MFNSLKYAKILEDAGLPRNQAETHIQIISEVLEEELASRQDFLVLEGKFDRLELAVKQQFTALDDKIEKLEYKIIFKLGSLMVVLFGSAIGLASIVL